MAEQQRCQWLDCTLNFTDAETLYEHITSTHIGRKSAGTLSLKCHWAGCSSKATKRDHLTSHARVHINLKPHSCGICQKSFKRPQDLKKHEKIHTEDHHAHHKHSKAVTAATGTSPSPAPPSSKVGAAVPPPAQVAMFAPFPFYPFPYGQHPGPMFSQHPAMHPQMDVNQFLEAQRQLNSQALAGNLGNPYGLPYSSAAGYPNMGVPMFAPPGMQSYPYGFYHPAAAQQQQQAPPAPTPSAPAAPSNPPSLYPSLPPTGSLYPSLRAEDAASPANSNHSQQSSHRSLSSASSLSPKVPSLSPASNAHSPSPEQESDIALRRMFSGNAVAGHKRAFEDAAGEFLNDLKSKRFQEEDLTQQATTLDELALLLTPNDFAPSLTSARSQDGSSGSSAVSEYHPADVENINDLLAHLAQSIDEVEPTVAKVEPYRPSVKPYRPTPGPDPVFSQSYPAYSQPVVYGQMYPSFDRPLAPIPSRAPMQQQQQQQQQYPSQQPQHDMYPDASIRMSKAPAPPTLSSDPSRFATYRHMEHLNRSEATYRGAVFSEPMEIDDHDEEEMNSRKGYSSSIRSTSLDTTTSASTTGSATPGSVASQSPGPSQGSGSEEGFRRSSVVTTLAEGSGPRLPPLKLQSGEKVPTTLPPLRDVIEMGRLPSHGPPPSSPSASSNHSSLYPSLSTVSRSSSSGGSLDRILPGFTLLRVNRSESEYTIDEDREGRAELDNEDHRSKKTRVDSPEPMDESSSSSPAPAKAPPSPSPAAGTPATAAAEKARTRQLVIRVLLALNNERFRNQVVKSRLRAAAAASPASPAAVPAPVVV